MKRNSHFNVGMSIFWFFICSPFAQGQSIQYNNNYSIACHNCYDPQYASKIEDVFDFTFNIEIDIWDTRKWFGIGGWHALTGDWYVRHNPTEVGNKNCCGGSFRDCLTRIKNWGDRNPTHNIITVFIDKKENWSGSDETRRPQDLDQLILSIFSKQNVLFPKDVAQPNKSLKESVEIHGWPLLDSLKGKFVFVITNGTALTNRNVLNEYLQSNIESQTCFVAPEVSTKEEVGLPNGFSSSNAKNIVFYNLTYPNRRLSRVIDSLNCLSRTYNSPETAQSLNDLRKEKVNFIALFDYKLK